MDGQWIDEQTDEPNEMKQNEMMRGKKRQNNFQGNKNLFT